ncbi:Uncharacterised protein [Mycobacteroides abscessus subsp. abscessus]|uniref:hypothetical protein n=1 Tax=Mycobacteroides abscessus TaxID=36809 RepID=UPI0009A76902|nr:hypothetical protein [Mycobacteroides abscessus]SLI00832.1 Uncharacterised protein [Mycobacteroides abscessus subsp. abscessus]
MAIRVGISDRDALKRDLEGVFPWASDDALTEATELVTAQLDHYETQPTYTMDRFKSAQEAGDRLTEIVGPVPDLAAKRIGRQAGLLAHLFNPDTTRLRGEIRRVFGPYSTRD